MQWVSIPVQGGDLLSCKQQHVGDTVCLTNVIVEIVFIIFGCYPPLFLFKKQEVVHQNLTKDFLICVHTDARYGLMKKVAY